MSVDALVSTNRAAEAVGVQPTAFRTWARRRGLVAVRYVWVGRVRHAVWDLDEVYDAEARGPVRRKDVEGN